MSSGSGRDTSNGSGTSSGRGSGSSSVTSLLMVKGVAVCRERIRRLSPQVLSILSPSHFHPSLL